MLGRTTSADSSVSEDADAKAIICAPASTNVDAAGANAYGLLSIFVCK